MACTLNIKHLSYSPLIVSQEVPILVMAHTLNIKHLSYSPLIGWTIVKFALNCYRLVFKKLLITEQTLRELSVKKKS